MRIPARKGKKKKKRGIAYLAMTVVALQVLDEGVHVLILLLILNRPLGSGDMMSLLLVKPSALNVGRQRGGADGRVFGHRGGCGR